MVLWVRDINTRTEQAPTDCTPWPGADRGESSVAYRRRGRAPLVADSDCCGSGRREFVPTVSGTHASLWDSMDDSDCGHDKIPAHECTCPENRDVDSLGPVQHFAKTPVSAVTREQHLNLG